MFTLLPASGRRTSKYTMTGPEAAKATAVLDGITGVSYQGRTLTVPGEPRMYEILHERCGLEPDESATKWYEFTISGERSITAVLDREPTFQHPKKDLLREYQKSGVAFMDAAGKALICDDTGLGKSLEAIVSVDISRSHDRVLIVCPNSVKYQWRNEIGMWSCLNLPVYVVTPKTAKKIIQEYTGGWLVMNYHNMRAYKDLLLKTYFDWIIFDEAHMLVNRKTQAFKVASSLKKRHLALMTGTPIGNSVEDLWALLNLIDPDSFPSFWRFFELYVSYTEDYYGTRTILGPKNETYLRRELAPRMIRRMKEDVAPDLPEKQHVLRPIEMTPKQAKLYQELAETMSTKDENGAAISVVAAVSLVLRLRQMVSTPAAFDMEDSSGKLDAVEEIITGTDEKVVVFSLFLRTIRAVAKRLTALGIPFAKITGDEDAEERDEAQRKLREGEIQVLLCTTGAGGTGLNLQTASIGIFIEKHWNPREQYQAENRLHRIGQVHNVTIYTLHCIDSIDDTVERVLLRKQKMSDAILSEALGEELNRFRKKTTPCQGA